MVELDSRWIQDTKEHSDLPEILEIEKKCFRYPWMKENFEGCMANLDCIGQVAKHEDKVIAYWIYKLRTDIDILSIAVDPEWQRRGVGRQIIECLKEKLARQHRNKIVIEVSESNLPAQLFFKEMGFRAECVLHDHYMDSKEDAYQMVYHATSEVVQ